MAGSNNGRGGSKKKLADQYKDMVPEYKRKDLDALIKKCNGDEDKITESIQAWWDEPTTTEEAEWEDVNKKNKKKVPETKARPTSSRGPGRGRGRGGSSGGRGAGAERGRRGGRAGRGGRESRAEVRKQEQKESSHQPTNDNPPEKEEPSHVGIPTPVVPSAPHGAWGQPVATPVPETKPDPSPAAPVEPQQTPSLDVPMDPSPQKVAQKPARTSGNVWATKGSAHLIKAENAPKPPPAPQPTPVEPTPPPAPVPASSSRRSQTARVPPPSNESPVTSALESGLPASVNGANINAAGWKPAAETTQLDSLGSTMTQTIGKEPPSPSVSVQSVTKTESATTSSKPPPTNVLNMGHWETGDSDDIQNLDFGFGSFGTENETPSVGETTMSGSSAPNMNQNSVENVAKETTSQAAPSAPPAVSPQRPPPGLSIAPPLPANAVLVSDLESKLESASLKATEPVPAVQSDQKPDMPRPAAPPGVHPQGGPILPGAQMNQNYNTAAYGMAAGMYNYNAAAAAAGNGFVGMHGAPVLAGGIPPKPQGGLAGSAPSSGPPNLPQGGLYGSPAPAGNETSAPSSENNNNSSSATATPSSNSMPPGMPNAMPAYANPALFYGQHSYQMGQPHGVGGYGYGYGAAQFGGAVQGGFGYQQGMMGQSGGYPYDDQQQQGNNAGYQKTNSGGYRGRGAGNQYQNNYNPQAGGYAGQPYGMGYNGGYAPGNIDPYNMQQGASGNFQSHTFQNEESHQKGGKRGGNGRNNGFQQQQHAQQLGGQQQQPQQQQQQSFGLQGGETNTNNNAGWSNQAGQAGGWSGGGGPSWQGS